MLKAESKASTEAVRDTGWSDKRRERGRSLRFYACRGECRWPNIYCYSDGRRVLLLTNFAITCLRRSLIYRHENGRWRDVLNIPRNLSPTRFSVRRCRMEAGLMWCVRLIFSTVDRAVIKDSCSSWARRAVKNHWQLQERFHHWYAQQIPLSTSTFKFKLCTLVRVQKFGTRFQPFSGLLCLSLVSQLRKTTFSLFLLPHSSWRPNSSATVFKVHSSIQFRPAASIQRRNQLDSAGSINRQLG